MIKTLFLLSLCGYAFSLQCYDCDPTEEHRCLNPKVNNIQTIKCEDLYTQQARSLIMPIVYSGSEYECFVTYFKSNDTSKTGVYRGCRPKQESKLCNFETQDVSGEFTECEFCAEDECNINSPNGSGSFAVSTVPLMLGAIICTFVFKF